MNIDTERLITEVRLRPALWDLSSAFYKDRDAKISAWQEVCKEIIPDFDDKSDSEKKDIGILHLTSLLLLWTLPMLPMTTLALLDSVPTSHNDPGLPMHTEPVSHEDPGTIMDTGTPSPVPRRRSSYELT